MIGKKLVDRLGVLIIICAMVLSGCSSNNSKDSTTATTKSSQTEDTNESSDDSEAAQVSVTLDDNLFDSNELDGSWDGKADGTIELKDDSIAFSGSGATVSGSVITISAGGTYVVSGTLKDGQIIVDASKDDKTVRLVLNGVDITCSNNAPIYVKGSSKTIITVNKDTKNKITDGATYVLDDEESGEPNAAIFSKDDLVINGTGSLTVTGNYNNAISGKDKLKITGVVLSITSKDDGILGKDCVAAYNATITVKSEGDGIKTTNDAEENKGYISLNGGSYTVDAGTDTIQAATLLQIEDGTFDLTSGGGYENAPAKSNQEQQWGGGTKGMSTTTTATTTTESTESSTKGLKAGSEIVLNGGTFTINSATDALHSNGTLAINGGKYEISAGDDGIHADSELTINKGTINITKSYEGIESGTITINDGTITLVSSDDGFNGSSSSSSTSGTTGGFGGGGFGGSTGDAQVTFNGGFVSVDASGDGLDSNGSMTMTGGVVVVSGPTGNDNGALDYDGTFEVTGGTLVAAGSSGMAMSPSDTSSISSIFMTFSSTQKAGTLVSLVDSDGNEIVNYVPTHNFTTIVLVSPNIKSGSEYTLYTGGSHTGTLANGYYSDGKYTAGTKVVSFTDGDTITYLNESGVTTGGNNEMGGGMQRGGNQGGGSWGPRN